MKLIASIILFFLCFLAVSPLVKQMDGCCDVVCTDTEKETLPTGRQEKSANDSCPFGICCCNYGICCYSAPAVIQFRDVLTETIKNRQVVERPMSNYLSDCWHPPEIV